VIAVARGQAGDSPMLQPLLAHLAEDRSGHGRPRTRPEAVISDKACRPGSTGSTVPPCAPPLR